MENETGVQEVEAPKPTQYVMIKYKDSWADEFDVESLAVWERWEWEMTKAEFLALGDQHGEITKGFGTNEEMTYSGPSDLIEGCKVIDIPDGESYLDFAKLLQGGQIDVGDIMFEELENLKEKQAADAFRSLPANDQQDYKAILVLLAEARADCSHVNNVLRLRPYALSYPELDAVAEGDPQSELWERKATLYQMTKEWWAKHGLYGEPQDMKDKEPGDLW